MVKKETETQIQKSFYKTKWFYIACGIIGIFAFKGVAKVADGEINAQLDACEEALEVSATYASPQLLRYSGPHKQDSGKIIYYLEAKLQNGFGAWKNQNLECHLFKQNGKWSGLVY